MLRPASVICPWLLAPCWDVGSGPYPGFFSACCSWPGSMSSCPIILSAPLSPSAFRLQREKTKKTPKRPPGKVARSRLSGLMSKMFQSSGNLLQSGILSLFTSKNLCKGKKKREKNGERARNEREGKKKRYLVVGSDRSTFLSIDMRSEREVLLHWGCCPSPQRVLHSTDKIDGKRKKGKKSGERAGRLPENSKVKQIDSTPKECTVTPAQIDSLADNTPDCRVQGSIYIYKKTLHGPIHV